MGPHSEWLDVDTRVREAELYTLADLVKFPPVPTVEIR